MGMKQQKLVAAPKILSFLFGSKRGPFSQYQMGVVPIAKSAVTEQVSGTGPNIAAKYARLPSVFTHALKNILP